MSDPLRILLATETSGGGTGRHVLDLAEGLSDRGHEVTVVYSSTRAEPYFRARLSALERVSEVDVPMRRAVSPVSDLTALGIARRLVRASLPLDVVHAHSSKAGAVFRVAALGRQCVRVYTPHAFRTMDPCIGGVERWLIRRVETTLGRHLTDAVICVGRLEREHARELGLDPKHLRVVPNGLDGGGVDAGARARVRRDLHVSQSEVVIGWVGRLEPQKDPLRFVRAVAACRDHPSPPLRAVLVGSGSLEDQVRRLIRSLGLEGRVSLVQTDDAAALMLGFDVLCMTSRYEGFPYVLLEGLAAGLPIVIINVGGVSELVKPGINGHVLEPSASPEQIGAKLMDMAADAQMRLRMGEASRRISVPFSITRMVEETEALYRELVNRRM